MNASASSNYDQPNNPMSISHPISHGKSPYKPISKESNSVENLMPSSLTSADCYRKIIKLRCEFPGSIDLFNACFRVMRAQFGSRLPRDAGAYPVDLRSLAVYKPLHQEELREVAAFIERCLVRHYGNTELTREARRRLELNQWAREMALDMDLHEGDESHDSPVPSEPGEVSEPGRLPPVPASWITLWGQILNE